MVNVRGAQYWRYTFKLGEIKDEKNSEWSNTEVFIYAHSEEEAREKISKWFKTREAELIERKPW